MQFAQGVVVAVVLAGGLCAGIGAPIRDAAAQIRNPVSLSLSGTVVDEEGAPLAGAEVSLCDEVRLIISGIKEPVAKAKTDERGEFVFRDVPVGTPTQCHLIATANGRGIATQLLTSARPDRIRIVMRPEAVVTGTVVDEGGRPLADARVSAEAIVPIDEQRPSDFRQRFATHEAAVRPQTKTTAEGTFRLAGLPRERLITLSIERSTYTRERAYATTASNPQAMPARVWGIPDPTRYRTGEISVSLRPGWDLSGRISLADTGMACSHAQLALQPWNDRVAATADDEGRFTITGLGQGDYVLSILATEQEGYVSRRIALRFQPGQGIREVETSLPRGTFVDGIIVDEATGNGIAGADVEDDAVDIDPAAEPEADRLFAPRSVRSGRDGKFRLLLPSGTRRLSVTGSVRGYDLPQRTFGGGFGVRVGPAPRKS